MRGYRLAWAVAVVILAAPCLLLDVMAGGLVRLVVLGPAMGLVGATLGYALAEQGPDGWRWAWRGLLWTGVGTVVADALLSTAGGLGVVAGVVLVLTAPAVLGKARSLFLSWSTRRRAGPPETLTTRDLHRRWDWTSGEVVRADLPVTRRLALVEERRALMDEIQLRDPVHFDAWIAGAAPRRHPERTRGGGGTSWRRGW